MKKLLFITPLIFLSFFPPAGAQKKGATRDTEKVLFEN